MKEKINDLLKGIAIGLANAVPGFSGGTMALVLNCYDKFINLFSLIFTHPLKLLREGYCFIIGILSGLILGVLSIVKLLLYFPLPTIFFFIGLIVAAVVDVTIRIKKLGKINIFSIIAFIVCAFLVLVLPHISSTSEINVNLITLILMFILGIVTASAMVIPGISGSMILLAVGYYPFLVNHISNLTSIFTKDCENIASSLLVVIAYGIGALAGLFLASKCLKIAFDKAPNITYSAILGLIFASPYTIIYKIYHDPLYMDKAKNANAIEIILGILLAMFAIFISLCLPRILEKRKNNV